MKPLLSLVFALLSIAQAIPAAPADWFAIQVVDDATGRGVPAVELRTTSQIKLVTDSAGWAAFQEPGLMNDRVWFFVESDGYEFPADGLGMHGLALETKPGTEATVKVHRTMPAERLYRITGQGIYRDSIILGKPVPTRNPLLNGRVMGQDSVQLIEYKDRLRWFWGDTGKPDYAMGHFAMSGAVSQLPGRGGLAPSVGVDLEYFVDAKGFSRPMVDWPEPGMKWADGLMVLRDPEGRERLVAHCMRLKGLTEPLGRSLLVYDDAHDVFVPLAPMELGAELHPQGQPFRHRVDGRDYFYFPSPYPNVRVPAEWASVLDPKAYEAYTCLAPGARYDKAAPAIERTADGTAKWAWKPDTGPVSYAQQQEMIAGGHLKPAEAWITTRDVDTSAPVHLWAGSCEWNEYRKAYLLVAHEGFGKPSFLGEVWLAEAPAPEGPWTTARRIITHRKHSFYNTVRHPQFDEEGGRIIYVEGTFTETFSGGAVPLARYDYNQIMYRVDLGKLGGSAADEKVQKVSK